MILFAKQASNLFLPSGGERHIIIITNAGEGVADKMKLLFTGFEPFCGGTVNPSWQAVRRMPDKLSNHTIDKMLLPVVFEKSAQVLLKHIADARPDVVVMVGLAGNRKEITPEKVAINYQSAIKADNEGNTLPPQRIDSFGPDAYITHLPAEKMVENLREKGIPASLSLSAGSFVCNDTFYRVSQKQQELGYECIFVHVPPQEVVSFATSAKALEIIAQTIIEEE